MSIPSERNTSENGRFNSSTGTHGRDFNQIDSSNMLVEGNQLAYLVEWLNGMLPHLSVPLKASEEELRTCIVDGTVLCCILDKLSPGSVDMRGDSEPGLANLVRFLAAMDEMGLPGFDLSDLEQGSMVQVLHCLSTLKAAFDVNIKGDNIQNDARQRWSISKSETLEGIDGSQSDISKHGQYLAEDRHRNSSGFNFRGVLHTPVISKPMNPLAHHVGPEFQEIFQLKQGYIADVSDVAILELIKSNNLDSASTQSLFSIMNRIFDETTGRKNGDVPHRVACVLRKFMQVIERRISTQAEKIKIQNNLCKAREEKYRLRIRVLETVAMGTTEETQVVLNQLQQIKVEKTNIEVIKRLEEEDVVRLKKENDEKDIEILTLKQELETVRKNHENHCLQLQLQAKETKVELEKKLNECQFLQTESNKKMKELEAFSESKSQRWQRKEGNYQRFIEYHSRSLQGLRAAYEYSKHEVLMTKRMYLDEFTYLEAKLKGLVDAAESYRAVLAENRKLYNEVQDSKGNIRVYCRIRPFLPGQNEKQTTIEFIGENGELVVANSSRQGKESHRLFKFNKVFEPTATQEEVFYDTQPLIRSVLDGYNVCIFAYGQTGSGKTYTMSGPSMSSKDDWGVNYRALNDLFEISQSRKSTILYEVGVQMVEIYNEQVRDLLLNDSSQKRLGIWNTTQPNGLAVPDASMHPVRSTTDVLELMNIGLMNRAIGATALNERSSRSHSVLTVHVRGTDLKTDSVLRGCLHLVDLAGSERVERSASTGDRLREAQHINKSLSALGDVIYALAQKNSHVPYRNSKLTQMLQPSLGGQAKTLMFVQLNPDVDSYSETLSTLKFAERVSGVELGAARSNKEGRDVKGFMEQVASLKDIVAKKDEEIERLMLLKASINGKKCGVSSHRQGSSSPRRHSSGIPRKSRNQSEGKGSELAGNVVYDMDNCSEHSDKHSEAGSQLSLDDFRHHKEFFDVNQNSNELLSFGDAEFEERLSDISDSGLSLGTESDSIGAVEFTLFPETSKAAEKKEKSIVILKPSQSRSRLSLTTGSSKIPSSHRKTAAGSSSSTKPIRRGTKSSIQSSNYGSK